MAYNEHIYMQKQGMQRNGTPYPCIDLAKEFRFYGMEIPFATGGTVKDVYKNEWADEDGGDEYIPEVLRFQPYDMKVKLAYKGGKNTANRYFNELKAYLTGRNGDGCVLKMYSTYSGIGRKDVRLLEISDDGELIRKQDYDLLMVDFTFRVNDPITEVRYDKETDSLV